MAIYHATALTTRLYLTQNQQSHHHMNPDLFSDLNKSQQQAVTFGDGPLLILAGAGSGKTRALTYRAAYLISKKHVPPDRILLTTFTNKAAQEMQDRLETWLATACPLPAPFTLSALAY